MRPMCSGITFTAARDFTSAYDLTISAEDSGDAATLLCIGFLHGIGWGGVHRVFCRCELLGFGPRHPLFGGMLISF